MQPLREKGLAQCDDNQKGRVLLILYSLYDVQYLCTRNTLWHHDLNKATEPQQIILINGCFVCERFHKESLEDYPADRAVGEITWRYFKPTKEGGREWYHWNLWLRIQSSMFLKGYSHVLNCKKPVSAFRAQTRGRLCWRGLSCQKISTQALLPATALYPEATCLHQALIKNFDTISSVVC